MSRTVVAVPAEGADADYARALCRHQSAPLLAMASIILGDIDCAGEIVVATLAAAGQVPDRDRTPPAHRTTRARLARSVYHRCLGHLAVGKYADRRRGAPLPFQDLWPGERAVVALALFSGLDIDQIAATLRTPAEVVATQLESLLVSG